MGIRKFILSFIVCFTPLFCVYSQTNRLIGLKNLYKECFEKEKYQDALRIVSEYINISGKLNIKEDPDYLDALITQAKCNLILYNDIDEFNNSFNKLLDSKYDKSSHPQYYNRLSEEKFEGFLFYLRRNLNDLIKINKCLELINLEDINLFQGSKVNELKNKVSILSLHKNKIFSLYQETILYYSDDKFELSFKTAQKLKVLLKEISLTENSLYAECDQIIGLSALLWEGNYEVFKKFLEDAIKLEYDLLGLRYHWFLQCYADGLTKYSKNLSNPENIDLLKKAIEIYKVLPKKEESGYQYALLDLSQHYRNIDINLSIKYAEKALHIQKLTANPDTIISYSNLCDYYAEIEQYDKAFEYGSIVLNHHKINTDYTGLRTIYKRLAKILAHKKNFKEAIIFAKKSLELSKNISSTLYAEILNNIGTYYIGTNDYIIGKDYLIMSYKCKKSISNSYNLANIYAKMNNPDSCIYYTIQNRNIFINDFMTKYSHLDEKDRFNYIHSQDTYHLLYAPIEKCMYWDFEGLTDVAYNCLVQNKIILNSRFDIKEIRTYLNTNNLNSIKKQLNNKDIVIEFWSNRDTQLGDTNYIYAFALKKDWNKVRRIKLLKEPIYKALRNELNTKEGYLPLYETIWKPILSQIEIPNGGTIYVALDDILSQIPIENICGYDWVYMGDKYNIRRVSDSSKITSLDEYVTLKSAYLYGGAINTFSSGDSILNNNIFKENNNNNIPNFRESFGYLPWSEIEIANASKALCNIVPSGNVYKMIGDLCTKQSIKQLSGKSPSILHIATHGFNTSIVNQKHKSSGYDNHIYIMDHTGLVFSNTKDHNNDYMLTASEISNLDLSATNLVILSSCNSGIGNFSALNIDSELIHAFKRAGVKSLIVTLSKIDDIATSLFMKNFYEKLSLGLSYYDAFKEAKKSLKESKVFSKLPYWSSFVMID